MQDLLAPQPRHLLRRAPPPPASAPARAAAAEAEAAPGAPSAALRKLTLRLLSARSRAAATWRGILQRRELAEDADDQGEQRDAGEVVAAAAQELEVAAGEEAVGGGARAGVLGGRRR
ncbi:MAG: hypothetical protein FRX48_04751 [Lasallia pustulata]|uniref:Uncharacterized protein n=1 Tax=Lasallia pustulata TaxID=136370 RepID=A0A5M8PS91_9LECA|nr:MAG: hypothetical protein FRX48_04751 [Lasallia pustulata]